MINNKHIEQNTLEWHEIKWRKIGGTLSSGLFKKSETLFIDLLSQYLEDFEPGEDSFENDHMRRGKELEPFAFEYMEKYTGIKFERSGWLQSEECPLLGLSPDGISECETVAFESKCLARKAHTEILLTKEIPSEHLAQLVHYFTVNPKLEKLYFIAFRPESVRPFIKLLTRDSLVDFGWKIKNEIPQTGVKGQPIKPKIETVPDVKKISEWTEIAIESGKELEKEIKEAVEQIKNDI